MSGLLQSVELLREDAATPRIPSLYSHLQWFSTIQIEFWFRLPFEAGASFVVFVFAVDIAFAKSIQPLTVTERDAA